MIKRLGPLSLLVGLLLGPVRAAAQGSSSWPTVHQQEIWLTSSVEHRLTPNTSLWFDANWRRTGIDDPQQVLFRPGILHTIHPGVRIGAGYTYAATAPYGETPQPTPTREHRAWQHLTVAQTIGSVAITHRYRWEQRWIAPVTSSGLGRYAYQQRARYMVRAQRPLGSLTYHSRAVTGYAQEEVYIPVGHGGAAGRLAQNRFVIGVGLPLRARQRLDIGYLNFWNSLPSVPANEVNHIVTLSWVVTSGR